MIVEMAVGDAYGAAFEFIKPARQVAVGLVNDTKTYQHHPEFAIGGGRYTDDTQMTIAVAETMLGAAISREILAENFVKTFKRDERLGYGSRFYDLLKEIEDGSELLERLMPQSSRSGAAMRVSPFGLYADLDEVFRLARLQGDITHDSDEGRLSASAIAAMVHFFAHKKGTQAELGAFLNEKVPDYCWHVDWTGWASVEGIPCAHAAVTAVRNGKSMRDVLERCINFGGDVDTIAAMAMFSASLAGIPNDLPTELYEGLEDGPYGMSYLKALDVKLNEFLVDQLTR